jgi:hypothetical protein
MPDCQTARMSAIAATAALAAFVGIATAPPSVSQALERPLAGALVAGSPSCHARAFTAEEQAARPGRRVATIAIERAARDVAAERKWGAHEERDGTPIVSATLRLRFRGDPVTHAEPLECFRGVDDSTALVCESRTCLGGEVRLRNEANGAIALSVGGALKSGRFIGHYIHLDGSCEGRAGGPLVLESGEDDRLFSLAAAPKEACR